MDNSIDNRISSIIKSLEEALKVSLSNGGAFPQVIEIDNKDMKTIISTLGKADRDNIKNSGVFCIECELLGRIVKLINKNRG